MSIAIIAEYNPFHNGHIHQIEYAKTHFPNDKIVVIMSGKYVQRGELAIAPFDLRRAFALKYGVSEVVELPFEYATQAAHIFAAGAIKMVHELKIDKLLFGSESNDCSKLILIAKFLKENQNEYQKKLKELLKSGMSFPKANNETIKILMGQSIETSNDILGMEYVKAIINNNYDIQPYCHQRTIEHNQNNIIDKFASASKIREMIFSNDQNYRKFTPMVFEEIPDRIENHYNEFQKIIMNSSLEELRQIKLMSEGLETRFKKNIDITTYEEFVNVVNSKRHTSSRIKRIMLYVLLGIKNI